MCSEARTVRRGGAVRSENGGMSSDEAGENPARRMSKVSCSNVRRLQG